jgi:hypothetical protein
LLFKYWKIVKQVIAELTPVAQWQGMEWKTEVRFAAEEGTSSSSLSLVGLGGLEPVAEYRVQIPSKPRPGESEHENVLKI